MTKRTNKKELAKRYTLALFESAVERHQEEDIYKEIVALSCVVQESPEFKELITSSRFNAEESQELIDCLVQKADLSLLLYDFFYSLVENACLNIFPFIATEYKTLLDTHQNILYVNALTAQELSEASRARLITVLENIFHKNISLSTKVDSSLIGGLAVQVGSTLIDASIKAKLQKLNLVLKGGEE